MQALFGAGSGGGVLAITAFNSLLAVCATFMVEVTLPTLGLLCHHEDDGAQAIGCIVDRLAPALRVRPPETATRFKRNSKY